MTEDPDDCEITTTSESPTPQPTEEPAGCCYGDSYKANDKCAKALSEVKCVDKGCNWLEMDDPEDCTITTTPEQPTTTTKPGCCAGDSYAGNDKCNGKLDEKSCDKISSCHWVGGGSLEDGDCDFGTTQPPEDPGSVGHDWHICH